jgi:hypothetical protein
VEVRREVVSTSPDKIIGEGFLHSPRKKNSRQDPLAGDTTVQETAMTFFASFSEAGFIPVHAKHKFKTTTSVAWHGTLTSTRDRSL